MAVIGSVLFVIWMYGLMAIFGIVFSPCLVGPRSWTKACLHIYLNMVMFGLRWLCGIRYEVRGLENLPDSGALIAAKHQSMFETLAFWKILPDPAIILKKELKFLPFFGWYAMKLKNIAVDRSAGAKALRSMLKQARDRAEEGRQIVIFPQGTRVKPGEVETYKPGVAGLYAAMKVPCVPVALNSGEHWPGSGFIRRPGTIVVEFLPAIDPGLSKDMFMSQLETRIETASHALAGTGTR